MGTLSIYQSRDDDFTSQDAVLFEEFANHAAIAISDLQLHRKLSESEMLNEIILHGVHESLLVVDWNGVIVTFNSAAEKLFGHCICLAKDTYYKDIFREKNPIREVIDKWLDQKINKDFCQGIVKIEDGEDIHVSVETTSVNVEQMPCLLVTVTDITLQKKMSESLEHTDKLSSLGRMAAQIAHEIGNPLTLISSKIQRLSEAESADPTQLRGLLSHVDRISSLIRRMSDLGRISTLRFTKEPIEPLIDNVLNLVEYTKLFDKIEITKDIHQYLPLIELDSNKITQVLLNLLVNAAQACDDRGEVLIRVDKKTLAANPDQQRSSNDYIMISVSDNGRGMEEYVAKKIFEPFYTTKPPGKGTGLGLAVSLSILSQHHGWINVESEVGAGSTLTVYLPVRQSSSVNEAIPIQEVNAAGNAFVLSETKEVK